MTVKSRELPVGNVSLSKPVMGKTCRFDKGNADEDRGPWVTLKTRLHKGRLVNTKRIGTAKDHQRVLSWEMCVMRWEELEKQPFAVGRGEQLKAVIWTAEISLDYSSDGITQVSTMGVKTYKEIQCKLMLSKTSIRKFKGRHISMQYICFSFHHNLN